MTPEEELRPGAPPSKIFRAAAMQLSRQADKISAGQKQYLPPQAEMIDTVNFERVPNASAILGILHHPSVWRHEDGEEECQYVCREDISCYIYTFIPLNFNTHWAGRCVTWDQSTAMRHGRSSAAEFIR